MKVHPALDANTSSATQTLPFILWNPKVTTPQATTYPCPVQDSADSFPQIVFLK